MTVEIKRAVAYRLRAPLLQFVAAACLLVPYAVAAQGLTGALIGTVKDAQGGVLPGAVVRISSPALIGGAATVTTNERGQMRFLALLPGAYALDIQAPGFATLHEEGISIGAGTTIERTAVLELQGVAESLVAEGAGSRTEARNPGFATRVGRADLETIPTRRSSMFDAIRSAPGVSPTSPTSGTVTTFSAFGSGTNENQFLIDGTNFTCPCTGIARAEPGVDFIQEIQIQSVGASAEFGNVQGAVINVVTRQGSEQFLADASYYAQPAALTSQPVLRPLTGVQTGYERARYHDVTANVGGPAIPNRLWFFGGYQYVRDYDSQPAADPAYPRVYEQDKAFGKLTWSVARAWRLVQSVHAEHLVNSDIPTAVTPFAATATRTAWVPAINFGELTYTMSANTLWDLRVGRFVFDQQSVPSSGNMLSPSRFDSTTGVTTGAPPLLGSPTIVRTTIKTALTHFSGRLLAADHQWKVGAQWERGGHHAINVVPSGTRLIDSGGQPSQQISTAPFNVGGTAITAAAFASDAITLNDRVTINAGLRFDHSRAFSQDLPALDSSARETDAIVKGLGTLYTWNVLSPRLGVTARLTGDGRTNVRASYGRFSQGVMTGELEGFHPGATSTKTATFDPATGEYTNNISP